MERTVIIDGQPVKFKATGKTPVLYKEHHQREIWDDIPKLQAAAQTGVMSGEAVQILDRVAYTMAKQADPEIPEMEDWLDQFEFLSIPRAFPEILVLWNLNEKTSVKSKKKAGKQREG